MNFKNIIIALLWATFFYTTPVMSSDPVMFSEPVENLFHPQGLRGELVEKKKMVEDAYYELVKNDHFDNLYINNLIIDLNLQGGVEKEGMILLGLIEWLARQKDTQSVYLLKKLNDLYFLEFTRFIVSLDSSKTRSTDMLEDFQALYHYSTHNRELIEIEPFRSTLSKLILLIHMVNEGELSYEGRKETLALALDKLKSEMLRINEFFGEARLERSIKSFVTLLEVYAVRDPLIKPRSMKKMVWGTVGIALAIYIIYKIVLNWDRNIKPVINTWYDRIDETIITPLITKIVTILVDVLINKGLFRNAGAQFVDGMAYQYIYPPEGEEGPPIRVSNAAVELITNNAMLGVRQGAGVPTMHDTARQVASGALLGVSDAFVVRPVVAGARFTTNAYQQVANWWNGGVQPVPRQPL